MFQPARRGPRSARRRPLAGLALAAAGALSALLLLPTLAGAATAVNHLPVGHLDSVTGEAGGVQVVGWAADPDRPMNSIAVRIVIQNRTTLSQLNWISHDPRPDVGRAHPNFGPNHGINLFVGVKPGTYSVCLQGLDSAGPGFSRLGCQTVTARADQPAIGHLDSVKSIGNNHITVSGWAADADTPDRAVSVSLLLGSRSGNSAYNNIPLHANLSRPDVAQVYPKLGPNHGFGLTVAARPGTYPVCAWTFDTLGGGMTFLGCISITV